MGHFRDKCPEPVDSPDEGGAKKAGGANAAKSDRDSKPEEAWAEDDEWNSKNDLPTDFILVNVSSKILRAHPQYFIQQLITPSAQR